MANASFIYNCTFDLHCKLVVLRARLIIVNTVEKKSEVYDKNMCNM